MNDKPKSSAGISVRGGTDNKVLVNTVKGFNRGVEIVDATRTTVAGNQVMSLEVVSLFQDVRRCIAESEAAENHKEAALAALTAMESSCGSDSFAARYKDFMSVLSDHMGVLLPIVGPFLPSLANLLPS